MERVSAWWNNLPKQTRKRTKKGVLAAAAALGGVLATGGALCVAVDCSPALQRHILATFVDRGTQTRVTLSPTATLQWDRAEFALWRGRITLHNVTYEARKHERTNELFLRARAARVALGLRPVCTLRRLLRYVDVSDLDATLDLRPAATFLRAKSAGSNLTAEQHPALAIDAPQSELQQDVRDLTPAKPSKVDVAPREERTDFTIGLLRIRNAVLNLITPFVFAPSGISILVSCALSLFCTDQVSLLQFRNTVCATCETDGYCTTSWHLSVFVAVWLVVMLCITRGSPSLALSGARQPYSSQGMHARLGRLWVSRRSQRSVVALLPLPSLSQSTVPVAQVARGTASDVLQQEPISSPECGHHGAGADGGG